MKEDFGCFMRLLGWVLLIAALAAFSLWTTYAIAESDLPEWVKYWLLK